MKTEKTGKSIYAKGKMWIESWDSLAECLEYAADNAAPKSSDKYRGDRTWAGGINSLSEAVKLGTKGYDEVRPKVERMFTELESQLADRLESAFQTRYDYSGVMVDVAKFLGGEPECMIDFVPEPSSRMGRVVKILVNGSASARIDGNDIIKRGVVICALVDSIHKLGMGVEVYVEFPTNTHGVNDPKGSVHSGLVKLHDSQQLLDINNLMFALCHPAMLRRIQFSVLEKTECDYARESTKSGYGYPSALECGDRIGADVRVELLQSGNENIISQPVDWVMSTLTGLEVL